MNYEDEDIVVHHSPLDQYLEEVSDLAFEKYVPEKDPPKSSDSISHASRRGYVSWLWKQFIFLLQRFTSEDVSDKFSITESCHILLNSNFLCEKDRKLLIDLGEEVQAMKNSKKDNPQKLDRFARGYFKYSLAVLVFSILCYIFMRCNSLEDAAAFAIFMFLIGSGIYYRNKRELNLPEEVLNIVRVFVDEFNIYNNLLDKVIIHIKEVEIITHGYSHIFYRSGAQIFPNNSEKCIKLRNCAIDGLINLFNQLRINMRIVLGNQKSSLPHDYKEEYIANMHIDLFSEILYSSSGELQNEVNVVPLDQIKSVTFLYRSQMSEFVYKVIVVLNGFCKEDIRKSIKDIIFSIEDLSKLVKNISTSLNKHLDISTRLIFQRNEISTEKRSINTQTVEDIFHNSELHLHSALSRVMDMQSLFKKDSLPLNQPSLDAFKSLFSQFNLSIENAKFCIENIADKAQPYISEAKTLSLDNPSNVVSSIDEDHILYKPPSTPDGDMLYEGESNLSVLKECDALSIEEIEKSLKDSKESRKLMRELKNVLSVKESPIGLISFPLTKKFEEFNKDAEDDIFEVNEVERIQEAKERKCIYSYEEYQNESNCSGDEMYSKVQHIGLPAAPFSGFSSKFPLAEETFGSSDDDSCGGDKDTNII